MDDWVKSEVFLWINSVEWSPWFGRVGKGKAARSYWIPTSVML